MDSIGETLRQNLPDGLWVPERPEPTIEALLDPRRYPSREVVERLIAETERDTTDTIGEVHRQRLHMQRRRLQRMLEGCAIKDQLGEGRPEGCWCLGRGWRVAIPEDRTDERILYCDCEEGVAARARHADADRQRAAEQQQARIDRLWRLAGLDAVVGSLTSQTWLAEIERRNPAALDTARTVLQQTGTWITTEEWLFLDGPFGRGKTVLLALICKRLLEAGQVVLWQNAPDLFERLRQAQRSDSSSDPQRRTEDDQGAIYRLLVEADVLAVDDLDKARPTDWMQETFYRIVNTRYQAHLRTLFTSNLSAGDRDLGARVGEAALHRIVQRCGDHGLITLGGPNLRLDRSP